MSLPCHGPHSVAIGASSFSTRKIVWKLREVELLRTQHDSVIIETGLTAGDRVVISDLDIVVEGMKIRVMPEACPVD